MGAHAIRAEIITSKEAWGGPPPEWVLSTFTGGAWPSRIYGPARFLRLLYHGGVDFDVTKLESSRDIVPTPTPGQYALSDFPGGFWISENEFNEIKSSVENDLKGQATAGAATNRDRLEMALRMQLRYKMAVCRDWSPCFDSVSLLTLPSQKSIMGLVGKARQQPAYNNTFPNHMSALAKDTILKGGITQFVINWKLPANSGLKDCIRLVSLL